MGHTSFRSTLLSMQALTTLLAAGCSEPLEPGFEPSAQVDDEPAAQVAGSDCSVGPIPDDLRASRKINSWYQKYANANGVLIVSSPKPPDNTLTMACQTVNALTSKRPEVRAALVKNRQFFIMLGATEKTNEPPEFRYLPDSINQRARGLGGQYGMCAEESILCSRTDRWYGENICVHEFSHTVAYGFYNAIPDFKSRLEAAFRAAKQKGLWANTYAGQEPQEYWAEGVQNWFYTNRESARPNGVHGPINTREEMRDYDPALYALIADTMPEEMNFPDCYRKQ
jgi:hypothetical protein